MASSPNEDKIRRLQQIVLRSKRIFLQDAVERTVKLQGEISEWSRGLLPADSLGESVYRYAHALKGMALTVGCKDIHRYSEQADSYSIHHKGEWTEERIAELLKLAELLAEQVRRDLEQLEGAAGTS
ncbi:Hpt domain-containing protein [Paenibacillus filicis]|uniref:Hpt domain-containing protein n=1 Tax=Paenibacillus gyeongsangnamensis TaxID=3388067 RepID=A0ABT4QLE2_9BACL|nr:Hpt domain-containing protein [Paenibacillus filicis]MCZ8517697.1 Hpt domain-containing protein [Paenibacillus filicis]